MLFLIIFYYQTFTGLKPILVDKPIVTHIHLASIHFGTDDNNSPYIHLNDHVPDSKIFDNVWDELQVAHKLGIQIKILVGGAGSAFQTLFSNFEVYYNLLKKTIEKYNFISGIDLDVEETCSLTDIKFLINRIKTDFGKNFSISMSPVAYALQDNTPGMGGFCYKDLYNSKEGRLIDYFIVQFYYDITEKSYENIINNGYPQEMIAYGIESGQNIELIISNLVEKYPNLLGVSTWEYSNSSKNVWALKMNNIINKKSYFQYILDFFQKFL